MSVQRVQWICPICKRRYAIPASAPTPDRCPQCREEAEAAEESADDAPAAIRLSSMEQAEPSENPLAALAAIQLEVAEEATRGPSPPLLARGGNYPRLKMLVTVFTVLTGVAAVGALVGLLLGIRAAFVMDPTPARTAAIIEGLFRSGGGLAVAVTFFAIRELILIALDIEENTRR